MIGDAFKLLDHHNPLGGFTPASINVRSPRYVSSYASTCAQRTLVSFCCRGTEGAWMSSARESSVSGECKGRIKCLATRYFITRLVLS